MESADSSGDGPQGGVNAENCPTWVRRHLGGSIYLWACGEKADDDDDDPKSSDRLIGWLILLVQGFAYAMLLVLSGLTLESDTSTSTNWSDSTNDGSFASHPDDRGGFSSHSGATYSTTFFDDDRSSTLYDGGATDNDRGSTYYASGATYYDEDYFFGAGSNNDSVQQTESPYLLPAVAGAMYLLIASTTHDLRAGFSLLVDGECAGHRAFGIGLLVVYGIMLSAAMSVIVSTSHDSASVVLNAVTVVFIADLDEKALKFLSTVPRKWRLFWTIYSVGISFVLAVFAVVFIGEESSGEATLHLKTTRSKLRGLPGWVICVLNPLAVTIFSYCLSACVQYVFEPSRRVFTTVDQQTRSRVAAMAFVRAIASTKRAIECVREDPCFFVAITVWVAQGIVCWVFQTLWRAPVAVTVVMSYSATSGEYLSFVLGNKLLLVLVNACLAVGLAMKGLGILLLRHETVIAISEPRRTSVIDRAPRERCISCTNKQLSSLLIGWGIGFWVTSFLFVLGIAWEIFGWYNAPPALLIVTWVILPFFVITSILTVADINVLGAKVGVLLKSAIEMIQNRRGIVYWVMATVFRDVLALWAYFCSSVYYIYTNGY